MIRSYFTLASDTDKVGVEPKGADCLRLNSNSEFIVTPKPRKKDNVEDDDADEEEEEWNHRSCLLRVQPGKLSLTDTQCAYMNSDTLKLLGWKSGNVVSVTAVQKPFSFELLDQQIRHSSQHHPESDKKATKAKKHRTVHCQIMESAKVQEQHIVLPLFARLQCLIEERTRVIVRYVFPSTKKLKKVLPTQIQLQEIRWFKAE